MKNVIVPVDFSPLSLKGIDFALVLAGKYEAEIQLVHVLQDSNVEYKSEFEKETLDVQHKFEDGP